MYHQKETNQMIWSGGKNGQKSLDKTAIPKNFRWSGSLTKPVKDPLTMDNRIENRKGIRFSQR